MKQPGEPLNDTELDALRTLRKRCPCTAAWLEHWLQGHRYYVAVGRLAPKFHIALRVAVLRLKNRVGLAHWGTRRWENFEEAPTIAEATLATVRFVEQILARPRRAQSLLEFRAYAADGIILMAHLEDDRMQSDSDLYGGRSLSDIELQLRREGLVSPVLPNGMPLWECYDFPWKLRPARPNELFTWRAAPSVYWQYIPPGCVRETYPTGSGWPREPGNASAGEASAAT